MFAASKSGQSAAAVDPFFQYVPLLLDTTSTNGQQNNTFLDSSTNNFTITRNGTPTQGSVTPYWPNGQWSNYFGGVDRLSLASNATFALGTGDFTIETWIYNKSTTNRIITWPTVGAPIIYLNSSNFLVYENYGTAVILTSSIAVSLNTWTHIAVCRSSSVTKIFINGVQGASGSDTNNWGQNGINIGSDTSITYMTGYLSNLRIVKGTALYTNAFTPSTTPLTPVTNTLLLTCQSNRFKDNSTNNFTITANGTPRVQAFQPFSPAASYTAAAYGGSGYFNGSTDYLTAPSTAMSYAGDFCIEMWFNTTTTTTYACLYSDETGSTGGTILLNNGSNNGQIVVFIGGTVSSFTSTSTGLNNGAWHQVALTRSGSTVRLFIDGALQNTTTASGTITTTSTVRIGSSFFASRFFGGYISNVRIVVGSPVYTATFTPPTAPVTAITNTSLLLNYTNAGIYDAAVQNNQITVGDAQASTTQYKWSPTSMKFDGTGDYLQLPSNFALIIGTASATIEFWIYPVSVSGYQRIITATIGGFAAGQFIIRFNNGTFLAGDSGGNNINSGTLPTINTWNHVAWVGNSGTTQSLYINGTRVGTSTTYNLTTAIQWVGGYYSVTPAEFLNGYLQDVRITNGVARYSGTTLTVPTAAFPTR